jgi:hypothetical protein
VFNPQSIVTLLDSGASVHCFTERELFTMYCPIVISKKFGYLKLLEAYLKYLQVALK